MLESGLIGLLKNPLIDPLANKGALLWQPSNFSSLFGWLDASDEGSITETSGAVSQWDDKSGNNYHATASGASRPTTGANTQNSLNVIDFSSDWFVLNSGLYGLLNQAYSLFAVSKTNNNGSQQRIINFDNGGSVGGLRYKSAAGTTQFSSGQFAGPDDTSITKTDYNILGGRRSGTEQSISANGNTFVTDAGANNTTPTNGNIGTFLDGTADSLEGSIAEIIFFNIRLSDDEFDIVEGYLAHKWGLTARLPSDHPYKSSAPTN